MFPIKQIEKSYREAVEESTKALQRVAEHTDYYIEALKQIPKGEGRTWPHHSQFNDAEDARRFLMLLFGKNIKDVKCYATQAGRGFFGMEYVGKKFTFQFKKKNYVMYIPAFERASNDNLYYMAFKLYVDSYAIVQSPDWNLFLEKAQEVLK